MYEKKLIEYRDGDTLLEGYCVYRKNISAKAPVILVAHDWSGKNSFSCLKAEKLAELGYVGFALDMYGKGKVGQTKDEKMALMQPIIQDRAALQKRMLSAFDAARNLEQVDPSSIGAIGFCFGGLCVLDLARSGAKVSGVVSFHGLLNAPAIQSPHTITSKVLVLHGFDDPMVTPDQVIAFGNEMTQAKVHWELDMYGNTMHAFTNPEANDALFGTVYNERSDSKSWIAMTNFFKGLFDNKHAF